MKLLFLISLLLRSISAFNIDERVHEYLTDPAPSARSGNPHYFGYNIDYLDSTKHFVVSSAGNPTYEGKVFSCDSNSSHCNDISPDKNLTDGQPLSGLVVGASEDGSISACLPLMEKRCEGHLHSVGFCYNRKDDNSPWEMLQDKECAPPIEKISLMFTIDGSSSMGDEHFNDVKQWIQNISNNLNFTMFEVGVVQFSRYTKTEAIITLGQYNTVESFKTAVANIKYQNKGGTATARGMELTLVELMKSGNATNIKRAMLLLTDGKSLSTQQQLEDELAKFEPLEVTRIAVGVGNTDVDELNLIASSPENVYQLENFKDLDDIIAPILNTISPVSGEGSAANETTGLRLLQKGFSKEHTEVRTCFSMLRRYMRFIYKKPWLKWCILSEVSKVLLQIKSTLYCKFQYYFVGVFTQKFGVDLKA